MKLPATMDDLSFTAGPALPAQAALELQDQLLCAATELDRLQRLLGDAVLALVQHFGTADISLRALLAPGGTLDAAQTNSLRGALDSMTQATQALQFQDMASQLIAYTQQRVAHCADRLAGIALSDEDEPAALVHAAPDRPNPVIQDEMDSGLIELF
jgi:ABC-type Fe3+-hydroxamate transport system substrate-binding protein